MLLISENPLRTSKNPEHRSTTVCLFRWAVLKYPSAIFEQDIASGWAKHCREEVVYNGMHYTCPPGWGESKNKVPTRVKEVIGICVSFFLYLRDIYSIWLARRQDDHNRVIMMRVFGDRRLSKPKKKVVIISTDIVFHVYVLAVLKISQQWVTSAVCLKGSQVKSFLNSWSIWILWVTLFWDWNRKE